MNLFRINVICFAIVILSGTPLFGQEIDVVKYRNNMMKAISGHMGAMGELLKGKASYAPGHLAYHAQSLSMTSTLILDAFPEGSMTGKTRAKAEIWEKWSEFEKATFDFQNETSKLATVVASGNLEMIGQQMKAVGKTCGSCHKPFRAKKK